MIGERNRFRLIYMRPALVLFSLLFALAPLAVHGKERPSPPSLLKMEEKTPDLQDPSDLYFDAWLRWKDGEKLRKEGKLEEATGRFQNALLQMKGIQKRWPDWKKEMVGNRIRVTEEILKSLKAGKAE